ncbi:MAG: murein hydrolase activator EnvC family protein [Candidatus Heteroscillospira sp.]|jgi:murein DD-endopeptidase MepM/ murein hydrolase activator NlpD
MHNRKIRVFCLLLVLTMAFSAMGAQGVSRSEIDALERQKDAIADKKAEAQEALDALKSEQSGYIEQKAALDEQNTLAIQEIELINEQIEIYDELIDEKEEELDEAIEREEYQKERFRARMRAMEENGDMGYIAFVFQASSFGDLLTRMDNISEIMDSDKALEEKYIAARENVEVVKAEYEAVQAEQLQTRDELEERKAELEEKIAEALAIITELEGDIDEYRKTLDENEAMEAQLQERIDDMIAELEKQQQAAGGGSISGTGSYIWPLPGYSPGSAYGWRMHPILHEMRFHAGEDVGAPSGTPILAADSGTVILAGENGGYGNCVMVSHGGGRVTLYAHMSSIAVSYGQSVSQGQTLGYVGSTGLSTGPHLHFEVRVNGANTDPKSYFNFG